ncbi:Uncharacterised protein [Bordetella pertussis]|nr:Uncharacterised protein [Bordetella pertussis]
MRQIEGSRSTGSRSSAFMRMIHRNTVRASGATNRRLLALVTMDLAWSSTMSTIISMKPWKRPGTPAVARRAASHRQNTTSRPIRIDQNSES